MYVWQAKIFRLRRKLSKNVTTAALLLFSLNTKDNHQKTNLEFCTLSSNDELHNLTQKHLSLINKNTNGKISFSLLRLNCNFIILPRSLFILHNY